MAMLEDRRRPLRDACERVAERFYIHFPCLADPVRRSLLCLRGALLLLHVVAVGFLFAVDSVLIRNTRENPWYTIVYLALFVLTLMQYFLTAGSSPGYVLDVMKSGDGTHAVFSASSRISLQSASRRNAGTVSTTDNHHLGRNVSQINSSSWLRLMADLYPPDISSRSWTCMYCNILQPPRSKHCHDCDKCVLQFDHHCLWLGTCIGQRNHFRFWWFLFEETALCIWTVIYYCSFLGSNIEKTWWNWVLGISLLLVLVVCIIFLFLLLVFHSYLILTNQTTYELVRRRRIPYLDPRRVPENVHPFSKGAWKNLYSFCCSGDNAYALERVPRLEELQARARSRTCLDGICSRCF